MTVSRNNKDYLARITLVLVLVVSLLTAGLSPVFADAEGEPAAQKADDPIDISAADVAVNGVEETYKYTGSEITPAYEVVLTKEDSSTVALAEDTDYTVSYTDGGGNPATPVEAGDYQLVITGQGDYTGTKTVPFRIIRTGWVQDGDQWMYFDADGNQVKSKWIKSGGEWYLMKSDGYMAANEWAKDKTGWMWMGSEGKITKDAWIKSGDEWYYLKANGYMATNQWAKDSKGWMWMQSDGTMAKDKWIKSGGQWYYLKSSGYMAANEWAKDGKGWMWMNSKGKITKDAWIKSGGAWYKLKSNGYMAANEWAKDSKGWMWMGSNGKAVKARWIQDGGEWYYLKADSYMAAKEWVKDSVGWMYMNASGRITKDKWFKDKDDWYYVQSNGYMRTLPYIFISIGEQKLYYYENGVCKLKTSVVTGKIYGIKYHGTPTGDFKVLSKQRNTHLKGLEDDGVTKYDSFVRYWMPFRADGYGMHDADWRGSFGGTIYQYYGSHGCVNMPVSAAEKLYGMISVGTKVHIQK